MITINMRERGPLRYSGSINDDSKDPFQLIDVAQDPSETAKEIVDNIDKATEYILKASRLIEESNDEIVIEVDSLSNAKHHRMYVGTLMSIVAAYITNLKGYGSRDRHGCLELAYSTEYSFTHTLYGLVASIIEHSNYLPEWYEHMKYNNLPIVVSNEVEGNFRIAIAVTNMLNVIGWERMRDATGEHGDYLDKYGAISMEAAHE